MYLGQVVEENSEFPYVVLIVTLLRNTSVKLCSGVIANPNNVLTAAHCFLGSRGDAFNEKDVKVSVYKNKMKSEELKVVKVYVHPFYIPSFDNDIAIVRLDEEISNYPRLGEEGDYKRNECVLTGYGLRYPEGLRARISLAYLHKTKLTETDCGRLTERMGHVLCLIVAQGDPSPCVGDSGGPILCGGKILGILSRGLTIGEGCGTIAFAVMIYEKVVSHRIWISRIFNETSSAIKIQNFFPIFVLPLNLFSAIWTEI